MSFVENPLVKETRSSEPNDERRDIEQGNGEPSNQLNLLFTLESFSRFILLQLLTPLFPTFPEIKDSRQPNNKILHSLYTQISKQWKNIVLIAYLPFLLFFTFSPYTTTETCSPPNVTMIYFLLFMLLFYFFPIILIVLSPLLYPLLKLLNSYFDRRSETEREKIHVLIDCFLTSSEHGSSRKATRIIACVNVVFSLVFFFLLDFPVFVYGWTILSEDKVCSLVSVQVFFIITLLIQTLFTIIPCLYMLYHYGSILYGKAFERKDFSQLAISLQQQVLSNSWDELDALITPDACRIALPGRHILLSLVLSQASASYDIVRRLLALDPDSINFVIEYSWYIDISILETALQANVSPQIIELLLSYRATLLPPHIFWTVQMKSDPNTVCILMDRCPTIFYETDMHNRSILHLLIQDTLYDEQSTYVIRELCQTNQVDDEGNIPLHYALKRCANIEIIKDLLLYYPEGLEIMNKEKIRPFHSLFLFNEEAKITMKYLIELIDLFLKLNQLPSTWLWMIEGGNDTISLDFQKQFTERLLEANNSQLQDYIYATDATGRQAIKLAANEVVAVMERFLLFCGRFEMNKKLLPLHRSETSVIYYAQDFGSVTETYEGTEEIGENMDPIESEQRQLIPKDTTPPTINVGISKGNSKPVVLKFMRNRHQYLRELIIREELMKVRTTGITNTSSDPFIESIISYDKDVHRDFAKELLRLGPAFTDLHYCIAMPAAEKSLKTIIDSEAIAGKDQEAILEIAKQIANALDFLHGHGVIHADLKPLNIMRTANMRYKLIDFDASVRFLPSEECGYCGSKWSSAYLPPEMLWKDEVSQQIKIKEYQDGEEISMLSYQPIKASPSYDLWAYGCILYQLFTNEVLWKANGNDNLNHEELTKLFSWDKEGGIEDHHKPENMMKEEGIKKKLLSAIDNPRQYYLLNHLLSPVSKGFRLSIQYILHHAYFHPTKTSIRMPGEEFQHHAFISYRVSSDRDRASAVYDYLTSQGLKVWFDQKNILAGEDWKESFCLGLIQSKVFIPIISREALRPYFETLTETSACDNVLLEYRLALELKKRGYLEMICPLFIGDYSTHLTSSNSNNRSDRDNGDGVRHSFSDYFASQCEPSCPNVIVSSIEKNLNEFLSNYSFGPSFLSNMTVQMIWNEMKKVQGIKIVGEGRFEALLQEKAGIQFIERILA